MSQPVVHIGTWWRRNSTGNPFQKRRKITVLDVQNGWVQYRMGGMIFGTKFSDSLAEFLMTYQPFGGGHVPPRPLPPRPVTCTEASGGPPTVVIKCHDDEGLKVIELLRDKARSHDDLVAALERIRGLISEDVAIAPLIAREALLKVPA